MKAIIFLFDGKLPNTETTSKMLSNIVGTIAANGEIRIDTITATILNDEDVMKCLVQHIVTPAEKPLKNEVELAREMQLRAFCNDVLDTCGQQPLADQATYKRRFITWMLNDTKAYTSEIVQSLVKPTKKQMEILREYGLQDIPVYLKLIRDL